MTTDDKTMIEQIETALQQATFDGADRTEEYAAAVLPIIRAQMAEAWDSCAHEADRRWVIGGYSAVLLHDANPYRADEAP